VQEAAARAREDEAQRAAVANQTKRRDMAELIFVTLSRQSPSVLCFAAEIRLALTEFAAFAVIVSCGRCLLVCLLQFVCLYVCLFVCCSLFVCL
jgi:hypothetical protein